MLSEHASSAATTSHFLLPLQAQTGIVLIPTKFRFPTEAALVSADVEQLFVSALSCSPLSSISNSSMQ